MTDPLIAQARTALDQFNQDVDDTQQSLSDAAALLGALMAARSSLAALITALQAVRSQLIAYQNALVDPNTSSLQDWQHTLTTFQINLTVVEGGLGANDTGWDKDALRVKEAYRAVYNIIQRTAEQGFNGDAVAGAVQFVAAFGGTTLQLTLERTAGSTPYAETQNPGGNFIYLYTSPDSEWRQDDLNRGYIVHTAENIIHEFGHVLAFRNGSDNSAMYQEWNTIQNYISEFDTTLGWSLANFNQLQNKSTFESGLSRPELEHERIANMFEAYVTGYAPEINDSDPRIRRAAWAMWTFMTGNCPPEDVYINLQDEGKPLDQQVRPCGKGFLYWLKLYGN